MDGVLESKKKEYDTNYNKAETVSLMTKYQMIFVKIEVYLMNLASIFHSKTQPDQKIAFSKIKERALEKREHRARVAIICVEKLKLNLSKLQYIVEKKRKAKQSWAFYKVKNCASEAKLADDMAKLRRTRIDQLRNLFDKKRQEYSQIKTKQDKIIKKQETAEIRNF